MTKAVAGGITLPAAVVEQLVDEELPGRFGGSPADWQLAERESRDGSYLEVRADPRLGPLDPTAIAASGPRCRRSDGGRRPGRVRVVGTGVHPAQRRSPETTRSGKTLAFQTLPAGRSRAALIEGRMAQVATASRNAAVPASAGAASRCAAPGISTTNVMGGPVSDPANGNVSKRPRTDAVDDQRVVLEAQADVVRPGVALALMVSHRAAQPSEPAGHGDESRVVDSPGVDPHAS